MTTSALHRAWPDGRLPRALVLCALAAATVAAAANVHLPHRGTAAGSSEAGGSAGARATLAGAPLTIAAEAKAAQAGAATSSRLPDLGLRIARTAELDIRVTRDVSGTLDRAAELARTLGGYVVSSRAIGLAGAEPDSGAVSLRVPSARFSTLVHELAELGREVSRTVASQDLTQDYVDTRSRLRNDRAVQLRLLALLDRAHTVSEVLAVQDRLAAAQQQVEEEQGRLDYLGQITSLSTVTLRVSTPRAHPPAPPHRTTGSWGIAHAFSRSAHLLAGTVGAIVIAAGALLPALVLAALAFGVARVRTRRRARTGSAPGA